MQLILRGKKKKKGREGSLQLFSHTLENFYPSSTILIFWVCYHIDAVPRKASSEICPFSLTMRDERSLRNTRSFRESRVGYIWRIIFLFHICFLLEVRRKEGFLMRVFGP